jgi:hypothetical protein
MTAYSADLIVYGSALQGIMAAYAAAKRGQTVIIVEPTSHLYGIVTAGLSLDFGPNGSKSSIIGGYTREVLVALDTLYAKPVGTLMLNPEPHGMKITLDSFRTYTGITTRSGEYVTSVAAQVDGDYRTVTSFRTQAGNTYSAPHFIDATYELDLADMAGLTMDYGTDAQSTYDESNALALTGGIIGYGSNIQNFGFSTLDANGNRLPGTGFLPRSTLQAGDAYLGTQAFNFRLCMTNSAAIKQPLSSRPGYNANKIKFFLNAYQGTTARTKLIGTPGASDCIFGGVLLASNNGYTKYDCNVNFIVSSNFMGSGLGYSNICHAWTKASWAVRNQIATRIYQEIYDRIYFIQNDASLSGTALQTDALTYGFCTDEFQTDYWGQPGFSPAVYVRSSRRLNNGVKRGVSACNAGATVNDPICKYNYSVDVHAAQHYMKPDNRTNSTMGGGYNQASPSSPYQISFREISGKKGQAANVLVACGMSNTYIEWGGKRLDALLGMVGEAAGMAAALSLEMNIMPVDLPYAVLAKALTANGSILN